MEFLGALQGLNVPDGLEFVFCGGYSLFCDGVTKEINFILLVLKFFSVERYVFVFASFQDLGQGYVMFIFSCSCYYLQSP